MCLIVGDKYQIMSEAQQADKHIWGSCKCLPIPPSCPLVPDKCTVAASEDPPLCAYSPVLTSPEELAPDLL